MCRLISPVSPKDTVSLAYLDNRTGTHCLVLGASKIRQAIPWLKAEPLKKKISKKFGTAFWTVCLSI